MARSEKHIFTQVPLGKLCAMITKPYFGALTLNIEHLGIDKNFSVLILLEQKRNCTQQYISDTLQIDKVTMVKVIDYFSKKGLVKRIQNSKDRREYFVQLTPKAHQMLPEVHKVINNLNDTAFKDFSSKERKKFYESMLKVYHNIEHLPFSHVTVNYKKTKRKK